MRTPKFGDRCEHAYFDTVLCKKVRTCKVRHYAGSPPGQLVVRIQDGAAALVCSKHAQELNAPNVRKQKKVAVVAEQVDLVEYSKAMELAKPNHHAIYKALEMPEGYGDE